MTTEVKRPLYPLIQFPKGVDLNDFYVQCRIAMCMAHVPSPAAPHFDFSNFQEKTDVDGRIG